MLFIVSDCNPGLNREEEGHNVDIIQFTKFYFLGIHSDSAGSSALQGFSDSDADCAVALSSGIRNLESLGKILFGM